MNVKRKERKNRHKFTMKQTKKGEKKGEGGRGRLR